MADCYEFQQSDDAHGGSQGRRARGLMKATMPSELPSVASRNPDDVNESHPAADFPTPAPHTSRLATSRDENINSTEKNCAEHGGDGRAWTEGSRQRTPNKVKSEQ